MVRLRSQGCRWRSNPGLKLANAFAVWVGFLLAGVTGGLCAELFMQTVERDDASVENSIDRGVVST